MLSGTTPRAAGSARITPDGGAERTLRPLAGRRPRAQVAGPGGEPWSGWRPRGSVSGSGASGPAVASTRVPRAGTAARRPSPATRHLGMVGDRRERAGRDVRPRDAGDRPRD